MKRFTTEKIDIIKHINCDKNKTEEEIIKYIHTELPCCKNCPFKDLDNRDKNYMKSYDFENRRWETDIYIGCYYFNMCSRVYDMYNKYTEEECEKYQEELN